jgi:hypothetical protein
MNNMNRLAVGLVAAASLTGIGCSESGNTTATSPSEGGAGVALTEIRTPRVGGDWKDNEAVMKSMRLEVLTDTFRLKAWQLCGVELRAVATVAQSQADAIGEFPNNLPSGPGPEDVADQKVFLEEARLYGDAARRADEEGIACEDPAKDSREMIISQQVVDATTGQPGPNLGVTPEAVIEDYAAGFPGAFVEEQRRGLDTVEMLNSYCSDDPTSVRSAFEQDMSDLEVRQPGDQISVRDVFGDPTDTTLTERRKSVGIAFDEAQLGIIDIADKC